ncbi:hypothetical protein [Pseudomonas koreensis]|uniref:hypothetical protein n=1 Tax=Pseudomonas koreensis TaxID=198620 RepID=UPI003F87FF1A
MGDKKDVLVKISYVDSAELLSEFLTEVSKIGLEPSEVRHKALPKRPGAAPGNNTKDVMITVSGDPDNTDEIIAEFLVRVENEIGLLPSSKNEKLLGVAVDREKK